MNYALDIAAAAVVIIFVIAGSRRGAVRMLISLIGYIAAFAAAVFVSNAADEYVYGSFVKPFVMSAMETKAEELSETYLAPENLGEILSENGIELDGEQLDILAAGGEVYEKVLTNEKFRDTLNSVFINYCRMLTDAFSGVLPEEVVSGAEDYLNETDMENQRKLELLTEERQSVTEIVEREIVRPLMMKTVNTALFAVTFGVTVIIFAVISRAAGLIRKIPSVRSADSLLGGLMGFLQSLLAAAVICFAVSVFIKLTGGANEYVNPDVISETVVFKWLYNGTFYLMSIILK
ncbi:MAG: CvpA family protein [Ruminococcus sp.]|nr:CvpA family protein [Ruminococcus sp.]MCM1381822.1 CvpA family protein [Muribaculaceae bacterium]MCM1480140.1 CvpA family protein [Muribaculaceae bacterium]